MATKIKLVPSKDIVHQVANSSHVFDVTLTGDFEYDHFRVNATDSTQARQFAIDEYVRRCGLSPASVDSIVQIS